MSKIVTIHQPEHLIWLGLIDKISKADEFVILDSVNFRKNYYQNRNKIRTKNGWEWLTVPVEKHNHKPINEVEISYNTNWQRKYLNKLKEAYGNSPNFYEYYPLIEKLILKNYKYIADLNYRLLWYLLYWFDTIKPIYQSSTIQLKNYKSSDLILAICKKLEATAYLSGQFGKDYLELDKFREANIEIKFHEFKHPIYKQLYEPFIEEMSAIDLLFNYGKKAKKILK